MLVFRRVYSRLQKVGIWIWYELCWFSFFSGLWGWGMVIFQLYGFYCNPKRSWIFWAWLLKATIVPDSMAPCSHEGHGIIPQFTSTGYCYVFAQTYRIHIKCLDIYMYTCTCTCICICICLCIGSCMCMHMRMHM